MSDDQNELEQLARYGQEVLDALPRIVGLASLDDAMGVVARLEAQDPARRMILLGGLASAGGSLLRKTVLDREAASRPWWKRWRKPRPVRTWFSPILPDGLGPGQTAAGQAMSAFASGRSDDAKALLKPWCARDLWEDDEYAYLLVGLVVNLRAAHRQAHEIRHMTEAEVSL
ncbi:hypothetical protein [Microbacterium halophytorum]|uniref:hypothetical protein n=1 Tax=Microbacterium halophytorum TaxID=2067568 RepID=UPI000CFB8A8F|nr:hypothetical protein [Microbacterium halophytorum]